jgi:hypothetical protein
VSGDGHTFRRMRFRDRPLNLDDTDEELYVSRPEIERQLRTTIRSLRGVVLTGKHGSGRTTLLRRLARDEQDLRTFAWVDARLAGSTVDLLELIALAIPDDFVRPEPTPPDAASPAAAKLLAVHRIPRETPTVIIIDGPLKEATARDLFVALRDRLWDLPHQWVWVETDKPDLVDEPYGSDFFPVHIHVEPFTPAEVDELMHRGVGSEDIKTARSALTGQSLTPREAISACRNALNVASAVRVPAAVGQPAIARAARCL